MWGPYRFDRLTIGSLFGAIGAVAFQYVTYERLGFTLISRFGWLLLLVLIVPMVLTWASVDNNEDEQSEIQ